MNISTILLATGGQSDGPCVAACDIARMTGAALHIVHAWNPHASLEVFEEHRVATDARTMRSVVARATVDGVANRAEEILGRSVARHLGRGIPARVIHDVAGAIDADLIVLGGRVTHGGQRLVSDGISEPVVEHALRPVLILHGVGVGWPPAGVLACFDGSPEAEVAAQLGTAWAGAFGIPQVRVQITDTVEHDGGVVVPASRPAKRLLAEMHRHPGYLVSLGTRRAVRGEHSATSVAMRVLRAAQGPVLIVPHSAVAAHRIPVPADSGHQR